MLVPDVEDDLRVEAVWAISAGAELQDKGAFLKTAQFYRREVGRRPIVGGPPRQESSPVRLRPPPP